jgi:hypothetical protein
MVFLSSQPLAGFFGWTNFAFMANFPLQQIEQACYNGDIRNTHQG